MKKLYLLLLVAFALAMTLPVQAQFKDQGGMGGGVGFGGVYGQTNLKSNGDFIARAFLRFSFFRGLQGELGAGLGTIAGDQYETRLFPMDFRFLIHPLSITAFNPYIYAGFGALHYNIQTLPTTAPAGTKKTGWTGVVPAGIGLQFPIGNQVSFEVSGGYNYSLSKSLEGIKKTKNDAYINWLAGLSVSGESGSADPDGDGLTNREEKQLGTDAHKADSDGDGLGDGEEVNTYHTAPLKADSDGDALSDGQEAKTENTDPNKADTDGDGLSDGDEVTQSKTDPIKADTDGDGLSDGDEVTKHKTNPTKADTDGDTLVDGDEVSKHRTNPLEADSDKGTLADGVEVSRGMNPLDASDDVPKEEVKVEVGKAIVLEGVEFATGKAEITPASDATLVKVYNTLAQNPEIEVEIQGYTDNVGKKSLNQKLSLARAEAVKKYLVDKGIAENRVRTKGLGIENPIASNKTKEGRQQNRRIEFYRLK